MLCNECFRRENPKRVTLEYIPHALEACKGKVEISKKEGWKKKLFFPWEKQIDSREGERLEKEKKRVWLPYSWYVHVCCGEKDALLQLRAHTHTPTPTHMLILVLPHTCTHSHIYTHIHTNTHTYTHKWQLANGQSFLGQTKTNSEISFGKDLSSSFYEYQLTFWWAASFVFIDCNTFFLSQSLCFGAQFD